MEAQKEEVTESHVYQLRGRGTEVKAGSVWLNAHALNSWVLLQPLCLGDSESWRGQESWPQKPVRTQGSCLLDISLPNPAECLCGRVAEWVSQQKGHPEISLPTSDWKPGQTAWRPVAFTAW